MPREGKSSITVDTDTFQMLKRNKPEGVTWDRHLKQLQYATDKENPHIPEDYKTQLPDDIDDPEGL